MADLESYDIHLKIIDHSMLNNDKFKNILNKLVLLKSDLFEDNTLYVKRILKGNVLSLILLFNALTFCNEIQKRTVLGTIANDRIS